jgi:large subunit ribosomal protein L30
MTKIAIILIRSLSKLEYSVKKTLEHLNLKKRLSCSVFEDSESLKGMLFKVKDFVTYGEISEDTYKELVDKKGEKDLSKDKLKPYFRLHPPVGGFERRGIKVPFTLGGALGKRDNMDSLIKKML